MRKKSDPSGSFGGMRPTLGEQYLQLLEAVLNSFEHQGLRWNSTGPTLSERECIESRRSLFALATLEVSTPEDRVVVRYRFPYPTPRGTLVIKGREMSPTLCAVPRSGASPFTDTGPDLEQMFILPAEILRLRRLLERFFAGVERVDSLEDAALVLEGQLNLNYYPDLSPLDQTNVLAEVAETRKIHLRRGGHAPPHDRLIHDSHFGRVCPLETPESISIGLDLFLASGASFEVTPEGFVILPAPREGSEFLGLSLRTVPFLHHSDGARGMMGGKNFKQALPLCGGERPLVTTGAERSIVELSGRIIRAGASGTVRLSERGDTVEITDESGRVVEAHQLLGRFVSSSNTALGHELTVREGQPVKKGAILASWPGTAGGELALGSNALVAYLPFFGYNIDDAIVVSRSFAQKMVSAHLYEFSLELGEGEELTTAPRDNEGHRLTLSGVVSESEHVTRGAVLARKRTADGNLVDLRFEEYFEGTVERVRLSSEEVRIWISAVRGLLPGDKLTGRHGNKGVVSLILDDERMPYFTIGRRRYLTDVLLNPNGIVSRMNLGQLLETHVGWLAHRNRGEGEGVAAAFVPVDTGELRRRLANAGLRDGKADLHVHGHDGTRDLGRAVVGYQYLSRLNQLAADKLQVRTTGGYSAITGQPLKGGSRNGGQRIGEMEAWCLLAHGAYANLEELFGAKSDDVAAREALAAAIPKERCASGTCHCETHFCSSQQVPIPASIPSTLHLMREYLRALTIGVDLRRADGRLATTAGEIDYVRLGPADAKAIRSWTRNVTIDQIEELDDPEFFADSETSQRPEERFAQVELAVGLPHPFLDLAAPLTVVPVLPPSLRPSRDDEAADLTRLYRRLVAANRVLVHYDASALARIARQRPAIDRMLRKAGADRAVATRLSLARALAMKGASTEWKLAVLQRELVEAERLRVQVLHLPGFARTMAALDEIRDVFARARKQRTAKSPFERALSRVASSAGSTLQRLSWLNAACAANETLARASAGDPVFGPLLAGREALFAELSHDPLVRRHVGARLAAGDGFALMHAVQERLKRDERLKFVLGRVGLLHLDGSGEITGGLLVPHARRRSKAGRPKRRRRDVYRRILDLERALVQLMVGRREGAPRSILGCLEGKYGILRHHLLGKRVDHSGRAVIVPDPALTIDQAGIPFEMAAELFAPELRRRLRVRGISSAAIEGAGDAADRSVVSSVLADMLRELEPLVLLNRAPSLHKYNILAFRPVLRADHVIALPPLIASSFNADFDGDTMAIHLPIGKAAQAEATRLLPSRNLHAVATGSLIVSLGQDYALGALLARGISKKQLTLEFDAVSRDERSFTEWALREQSALFSAAVAGLASFSFFDVRGLASRVRRVQAPNRTSAFSAKSAAAFNANIERAVEESHIDGNPLSLYRRSGAKGDKSQFRQLAGAVGVIARRTRQGLVYLSPPILRSFATGLSPADYLRLAHATRRTMLDKKLSVGPAGALTRDLVEGAYDMVIGAADCGTQRGLEVALSRPDAPRLDGMIRPGSLQGRVVAGRGKSVRLVRGGAIESASGRAAGELSRSVRIRSPLTCTLGDDEVCQRCYGLSPDTGLWPAIGALVGILAAQSVGERGTQLSMRTFHSGGEAPDVRAVRAVLCDGELPDDVPGNASLPRGIERDRAALLRLTEIYEGEGIATVHFEVLLRAMRLAVVRQGRRQAGLAHVASDAVRRGVLAAASYRDTARRLREAFGARVSSGRGRSRSAVVDSLRSPKNSVIPGGSRRWQQKRGLAVASEPLASR